MLARAPDVLISDWVMPGMAGDEVCRYDERKGTLEVDGPDGSRSETLPSDLAEFLHTRFGVSEPLLRAHFAVGAQAG